MSPSIADFPAHPAFAGLRAHFAKLIADGADAAHDLAARQVAELKRQWRVLDGQRGTSPSERKTLLARMSRDKVDAPDLLSLITWLEAIASLDRSLAGISASDDITRHMQAAE
ncbi:hypothetical protein [Bosea sp. UC22_33]|uniref:hypothetical protein n=1 Tax=Bosea sp. UC22_33 TaxID=3350165 RepID=UPI00366ED5DE